jgi:ribosomal protein S1
MKKSLVLNKKINTRNIGVLKSWLGCYEISKRRFFEGIFCEKTFSISLGIKYKVLLERDKKKSYKKLYELKIIQLETSFSCIFFKFQQEVNTTFSSLLIMIKHIQKKKILLTGRVLNDIKGGFAVGSIGLICFLPKSRAFNCKVGFVYSFLILSVDNHRHSFVLSQKRLLSKSKGWKKKIFKRTQVFKKLKAIEPLQ